MGTQATQAMVSLVNNPNFVNDLQGVGIAGLRDGSVGAYFSGSWDYKSVKEILGDNFGAVSLPTVKIGGKDKQMLAFAGSIKTSGGTVSDRSACTRPASTALRRYGCGSCATVG